MLTPTQLDRLKAATLSSLACEARTHVPALLTVAQWAVESQWGAHQPGNNCFGIKAYPGCSGEQTLLTTEVVHGVRTAVFEKFATFPTLEACFEKHGSLFTVGKPYAAAWGHYCRTLDLPAFVREMAPIYATDPNYASVLLKVMAMPEVKAQLPVQPPRPSPQEPQQP